MALFLRCQYMCISVFETVRNQRHKFSLLQPHHEMSCESHASAATYPFRVLILGRQHVSAIGTNSIPRTKTQMRWVLHTTSSPPPSLSSSCRSSSLSSWCQFQYHNLRQGLLIHHTPYFLLVRYCQKVRF